MDSPTKEIREALGDLSLHGYEPNANSRSNGGGKRNGSIKNHLQVPQLVLNADFDKENAMCPTFDASMQDQDFGEDTVVHNRDSKDTTIPEWLKVKMEMDDAKKKTSQEKQLLAFQRPYLVKTVLSGSTAAGADDGEDDGEDDDDDDDDDDDEDEEQAEEHNVRLADTTWELMKKNYNIDDNDVYGRVTNTAEDEYDGYAHHKEDEQAMNNTAYSFQDTNSFRAISDHVPSMGTAKITSYRTEYLDSPMPRPKLIKTFDETVDFLRKPQLKTEYQQLNLVTPMDEGMVYDSERKIWVYPNRATHTAHGYDLVLGDEDEDASHVSVSQTNNSTVATDPGQVTNVSRLDLSFSESRRALVAALQDVLKTRENWDKITNIDISGKGLLTVKSLEEFVPNLRDVDLADNSLTSLEGLSGLLHTALLANNLITDQFLNFDKYKSMQQLDLSHNKITKLSLFSSLESLRYLNLSDCKVETLVSLPSLLKLNLSNNSIKGHIDFQHLDFCSMQELDLSGNKITAVKSFNCESLRVLNVERNELEVFEVSKGLPKMKKFLLSGNANLKELDLGTKLKQLRFMSISGSTRVIARLPELLTLCLYECPKMNLLKQDDFVVCQYLQEITARSCQLEFKDLSLVWEKFPHLKRFDFRDNKIECLYAELVRFFTQFGKVAQVKLNNNPVTERLKDENLAKVYELMMYKLTHQ